MRLGAYPCHIQPGSIMEHAYGSDSIAERHRHRYEFNNAYRETLTAHGMRITGTSPDKRLVEAVEIPGLRFFIGVQYHPEFKSRPNRAHPLFREFVKASAQRRAASRDYALETQKRVAYIQDTLKAAGAQGIVFGNSGGKDSALVGILCRKGLPAGSGHHQRPVSPAAIMEKTWRTGVRWPLNMALKRSWWINSSQAGGACGPGILAP